LRHFQEYDALAAESIVIFDEGLGCHDAGQDKDSRAISLTAQAIASRIEMGLPAGEMEKCVHAGCGRRIIQYMKLPKLEKPVMYQGLYVFDFGDHVGVGFTAEEVAELLESERYKDGKVYKIHRAYPDGRLELKGIRPEKFQLEAGMFFYSWDEPTARADFKRLVNTAVRIAPPCRAKVYLARYAEDEYVVALIYPAEYDDEISSWLLAGGYRTAAAAEGGIRAVESYYGAKPEILDRHQLFGASETISRTGEELLTSVALAVQR